MEFFIPVPVLPFNLLGLDSSIATMSNHISPLSSCWGFSFLLNCPRNPCDLGNADEEMVCAASTPQRESPVVCCCLSVPHEVLLKTGPYLVTSNADPLLNLGPESATLRKEPTVLGSAKVPHVDSQGRALGIVLF